MAASSEDHEERLMQAMAYYGHDLSPEETAEFEAHLATCDECREMLEVARTGLPFAEALLAFEPKHTLDEQMARFEAMRAERAKGTPVTRPAREVHLHVNVWIGALLALAMGAIAFLGWRRLGIGTTQPTVRDEQEVYAPVQSVKPDGG
jgi:predicted anti-sigma-YlaC factor YlaD